MNLIDRLRRSYVDHGTNYVQEAADEIERLTAERDEFHRIANQAVAERETVKAECDALKAHAELRYTAFQSPHNDDSWLEHPADSEIIDEFDPPVHVGFEYELTAGVYTTQRYRVTKIADDESDDVEVELIATIQGAGE